MLDLNQEFQKLDTMSMISVCGSNHYTTTEEVTQRRAAGKGLVLISSRVNLKGESLLLKASPHSVVHGHYLNQSNIKCPV